MDNVLNIENKLALFYIIKTMQEKIKRLEKIASKYIKSLNDLKKENLELKEKLKKLENENFLLMSKNKNSEETNKLKLVLSKRISKLIEKIEKHIQKEEIDG
jgi:DNA repair ATPase RecN